MATRLSSIGPGIAAHRGIWKYGEVPLLSLAELQALVRVNAPVFTTLHEGFNYDYHGTRCSFSTNLPELSKLRKLARFIALDMRIKRMSGDWNGAANDAIDSIRVGGDIARGLDILGMLVGVVIQATGRDGIEQCIDHLNAAQARAAAQRLAEVDRRHTPFADALQEEKWGGQAGLMEIFRKANWRHEIARLYCDDNDTMQSYYVAMTFTTSKGRLLNDYTRFVDAAIAKAKLPYTAAGAVTDPPLPKNILARTLVPIYSKARRKEADCQANNDLLMLEFALRAYRLEHGNYPATLKQLLPADLLTLPHDPFSAGDSLHYQRTGQGYTLYSIGPNGKDDHGMLDDIVVRKH